MAKYKRLFLSGHSYYLTLVTHRRKAILIDNIDILRESFRESKQYYSYTINAIVILPEHIHMIITPKNAKEYPKIIKAIKYNFSKKIEIEDEEQSLNRHRKKMKAVWQQRYYEHTIRDQKDYLRCLEYMKNNPVKHQLVKDAKDWKYSSFFKP